MYGTSSSYQVVGPSIKAPRVLPTVQNIELNEPEKNCVSLNGQDAEPTIDGLVPRQDVRLRLDCFHVIHYVVCIVFRRCDCCV